MSRIVSRIVDWFNGLPQPIRAALRTFLQVFVAMFAASLIGWLGDVVEWATRGGEFPDAGALGKAFISAFAAGVSAVVSWLHNLAEVRGIVRPMLKGPSLRGDRVVGASDGERYVA